MYRKLRLENLATALLLDQQTRPGLKYLPRISYLTIFKVSGFPTDSKLKSED